MVICLSEGQNLKPTWPAEPTHSILTLLMGVCGRRRHIYYKVRIFPFADMLPVKVFMSILYSIATKFQV